MNARSSAGESILVRYNTNGDEEIHPRCIVNLFSENKSIKRACR